MGWKSIFQRARVAGTDGKIGEVYYQVLRNVRSHTIDRSIDLNSIKGSVLNLRELMLQSKE